MQSLRRTPGVLQQGDIVLNVAACGALWPMCQCWSGYRSKLPLAGPGPELGSSGDTAIRGHTHPAGVTGPVSGVRSWPSGRRDNTHMSREHRHGRVAKFFSKDSKYQHTAVTQTGDLTQDWLTRRESVPMLAWRLFFSAHFIVGTYLVLTAGNKGQWCQ